MSDLIDLLSKQQLLWKGRERTDSCIPFVVSGYQELDQHLGGLPRVGVLNINTMPGVGELRLLFPSLVSMQDEAKHRLCVFINPPGQVCAEFLYHQGFNINRVLVVNTQDKNEALWAAEACAKSGACCAVLLWNNFFELHQVKRLQLACEEGNCLQVLFRSPSQSALSLPVALSLKLTPSQQGLSIKVMKRKGGWPISDFTLDMSQQWPSLSIPKIDNVIAFPLSKNRISR